MQKFQTRISRKLRIVGWPNFALFEKKIKNKLSLKFLNSIDFLKTCRFKSMFPVIQIWRPSCDSIEWFMCSMFPKIQNSSSVNEKVVMNLLNYLKNISEISTMYINFGENDTFILWVLILKTN